MPSFFWKGIGMGRKLSLSNLAFAVTDDAILVNNAHDAHDASDATSLTPAAAATIGRASHHAPRSHNPQNSSSAAGTAGAGAYQLSSQAPPKATAAETTHTRSESWSTTLTTPPSTTTLLAPFSLLSLNLPVDDPARRLETAASALSTSTALAMASADEAAASNASDTTLSTLAVDGNPVRPLSTYSIASNATTIQPNHPLHIDGTAVANLIADSRRASSSRPRSRATDILLNLEASSNDTRFQEILHNTIALDHFRQFCFQEYSIENLLFWMDVELFAKGSPELWRVGRRSGAAQAEQHQQHTTLSSAHDVDTPTPVVEDDQRKQDDYDLDVESSQMDAEQFAVQHARYIYLTYIDSCGPLQVNLSDESRTDIPWPILDHRSDTNLVATSTSSTLYSMESTQEKPEQKRGFLWGSDQGRSQQNEAHEEENEKEKERAGWPLDRHMFDGAQEHTYQLMKGHTLVRFEESDLWKIVEKIKREQPDVYAKATIAGPLSSYYRPDASVILSTVVRSRSRHPRAKPLTLYNWNNSTSDLDRSHDKEEALAKTMSQYFGPIPASIRHPTRVILGLGRSEEDELDDSMDDFDMGDNSSSGIQLALGSASKLSSATMIAVKKNRFAKRLSDGITGRHSKNHSTEDMTDIYADDIDSDMVENGRRTTRWMVAGYFNDQVRLTAAQRKRLLRRNNKLTKFFGSRVDGTLRPVEEIMEEHAALGGFGMAADHASRHAMAGSSSAPSLGSPLAYALSSSTVHDMDKKSKGKKLGRKHRGDCNGESTSAKRNLVGSGSSAAASESRLLLPGTNSQRLKSTNLLQKFRRSTPDLDEDSKMFDTTEAQQDIFDATRSPGSSFKSSSLFRRSNGYKENSGKHFRSITADAQHQRRLLAHPHPLWSGSLSDQEGSTAAACERRRGLSILSIMGNNTSSNQNISGGGITPTTPTSTMPYFCSMPRAADPGGADFDRQAMSSRRKKADKLSMFFGAQLSTLELSSQLPMDKDDEAMIGSAPQHHSSNRVSNESKHSPPRVTGPTYSAVNQLSHQERSVLWKRNKKLRELLGESLPEADVALALTRPVLLDSVSSKSRGTGAQARRGSVGNKQPRRRRQSSFQGSHMPLVQKSNGEDDADCQSKSGENSDEYEDEVDSGSGFSRRGMARVSKRNVISARARRPSIVSVSSRKSAHSRNGRVNLVEVGRPTSDCSLESFLTIDSLVNSLVRDPEEDDDDMDHNSHPSGAPPLSARRRKSSVRPIPGGVTTLSVNTLGIAVPGTKNSGAMSRFRHKKRMDKIHQFLGDRIPEQDLWMGTVGREKTLQMLDQNLLSPTSSLDTGSSSSFGVGKHGFTGRNGTKDAKMGHNYKNSSSTGSGVSTRGGQHERSLSDTSMLFFGLSKTNGQNTSEDLPWQQQVQFSTTSRLRQQLASPTSPASTGVSGIGQLLNNANISGSNNENFVYPSPIVSGPASPSASSLSTVRSGFTAAASSLTSPPRPPVTKTAEPSSMPSLQDVTDEADDLILSKLRAMSDKDQDLFLKKAGKLEKYFGQFPPSALLESSFNTFPGAGGLKGPVASAFAAGIREGEDAEDARRSSTVSFSNRPRSLAELAGLLGSVGKKSGKDKAAKYKSQTVSMRTSEEDTVESLGIVETQFNVEI
ncbi:hypothetical protein BGZ99_005476 [Dissophora globulifera]|uniref:RGS domain-containing protein n=1 Tax=Dissophora globulifera TaxID=979702 RepID=A0A9P6RGW6_9FUNG|nr:hypothetical protein BGZ99_005476 [Dissophora globulifera]